MKNLSIARRYARALFELAGENKSLDDVLLGMSNLRHALTTAPDLRPLLVNPMVRPEDKRKLILAVTSNPLILKIVELLARRKRIGLLEVVHDMLLEMSDASQGILRALVRSAQPLSEEQKRTVEAGLAKSTGGKIIGRFEIDPGILGGVWAKIGDKVLDVTLRGRLDTMRQALLHSTN